MPTSCSEIKQRWPNSPSGFYQVIKTVGEVEKVYCHMTELCGSDGPWTRVAHLNMSNPSDECPDGFRKYSDNGVTFCGRPVSSQGGCQSVKFQTFENSQEKQGCCQNPNLPWFHKTLDQATSDDIELRVCCDQDTTDEDVPVCLYDIYVK